MDSSLRSLFRVLSMALMLSWMFRRPVSLAKQKGEENLIELSKSFMCKRKSRGPGTDPYGTPKLASSRSDEIPSIEVLHSVSEIGFKAVISYSSYSIMPQLF